MKIKVFITCIVSILLLGIVSTVGYHYYLVSQAKYLTVRVAGVDLVKLGTAHWLYPARVERAFDKTYDGNGLAVRIPKYEHNVIIDQEIDGDFIATMIGTNKQQKYKGGQDTAYICVSPNMQKAPIEGVDPKKDMANYKYLFFGDGYRGQVDAGALDLDFLADLPLDEARAWLTKFNGVGPKTAAIVLCFSLNMPAFPVDTHIYRVTGRLGLRPERMSVEQAHPYLESIFPPETYYAAHLNLIRLGREVCKARKPNCPRCPIIKLCEYKEKTK